MRQITRLEIAADGGRWNLNEHGIGRPSSYPTKTAAPQAGQAVARRPAPSKLISRNDRGRMDTEHTYDRPGRPTAEGSSNLGAKPSFLTRFLLPFITHSCSE